MRPATALAACLLIGGCATASVPVTVAIPLTGYLDAAAAGAVGAGFSPSPVDPLSEQAVFDSVGPGTDRWWLAIADAELRPPEAAQHFDCVLGTRMADRPRPALVRMMNRLLIDASRTTAALAEKAPRRRPVAEWPGLQPCVRMDAATRDSPSWPSGGAVTAAAYGELFATLAPDRAQAVRRRSVDLGLSRALCRLHWQADVIDGFRIGRTVHERAAATPAFVADLEAARAEIAAARAEGLTNPGCAAERRALGQSALTPDGD